MRSRRTWCCGTFIADLLFAKPERAGRLGVIDFQDALWAIPPTISSRPSGRGLEVSEKSERALFDAIATARPKPIPVRPRRLRQSLRHPRRAAEHQDRRIFARLSMRDGKHGYLAHLPRISRYLFRNLAHPDLKPLDAWYEAHLHPLAETRLEQGALR